MMKVYIYCLIVLGMVKVSVTPLPVNTKVLITWKTPLQPNGVIMGYQVIYSVYNSDNTSMSGILNITVRNYTIMTLSKLRSFCI